MIMNVSYRGKIATENDIKDIKQIIKREPKIGRTKLSQQLCNLWGWRQANGQLRDMVCRGFLLEIEKGGYIELPPRKFTPNNPFLNRKKPLKVHIDKALIKNKVSVIKPLRFMQVRNTTLEKTFNGLIEEYHYLGYCHQVGEQLKYLVYKGDRPVACFSWSSAANWINVGNTTGRGKDDHTNKQNRSIKSIYGYPLTKDFKEKMCNG